MVSSKTKTKTAPSTGSTRQPWVSHAADIASRASEGPALAALRASESTSLVASLRASEAHSLAVSHSALTEAQKALDGMKLGPFAGALKATSPTVDISSLLPAVKISSQLEGMLQPLAMQAAQPMMTGLGSKLAESMKLATQPLAAQLAKQAMEMAEEMAKSLQGPLGGGLAASSIASQMKMAGLATSSGLLAKNLLPEIDKSYLKLADGIGIASGLNDINSWIRRSF